MKNETQQPFQDGKHRNPDDSQLVEQVLGTEQAAEMLELTGEQASPHEEPDSQQLELNKDEDAATIEAEKSNIEKRREEYTKWAEDIGKDEDWMDEIFIFHSDGTVETKDGLALRDLDLSTGIPSNLVKINGDLDISFTGFDNLDLLRGTKITGDLWIMGYDVDDEKFNTLDIEGRIFN